MPLSSRFSVCALWALVAPFVGASAALGAPNAPKNDGAALSSSLPFGAALPIAALPGTTRVGGARALRLIDSDGRALGGIFSEPKWETRGGGLFFTREFGGTRNIWRAFPDPQDGARYPRWRALPVTQFVAPLFAARACPIEGNRALLMLSNATNPRRAAQVTLYNLTNRSMSALTESPDEINGLSPAPDSQSFAFSTLRRGVASVWIQSLRARAVPRLVAPRAWRPAWQNAETLLIEKFSDNDILRLPVGLPIGLTVGENAVEKSPPTAPKIASGTQVSASRDGATLVVVGKGAGVEQLYLLSGDGSGRRALSSTEGAQSPALSGDGTLLAFTASLGEGSRARALWILPLKAPIETAPATFSPSETPAFTPAQDTAPATVLAPTVTIPVGVAAAPSASGSETRPLALKRRAALIALIRGVEKTAGGAFAITGTASGRGASATLEIGQGTAPKRWESFPVTLSSNKAQAPLLLWTPPPGARGIWSLRLSVAGDDGAAQSMFSVQLPFISSGAANAKLPRFAANATGAPSTPSSSGSPVFPSVSLPASGPLPNAPLPDLPAPPPAEVAALPPLLPAPNASSASSRGGATGALPAAAPSAQRPATGAAIQTLPRILAPSSRLPIPIGGRDAATFNVSNTLAQMRVGQRVNVTFWALNRGDRAWDAFSALDSERGAVRLVMRWVRFDTGNRRGWGYQTMKAPVLPGARTRWDFEVVAPTQPGRYKLIYALQRITPEWKVPAYNAPQENWPGDFAVIAFAVDVKP